VTLKGDDMASDHQELQFFCFIIAGKNEIGVDVTHSNACMQQRSPT